MRILFINAMQAESFTSKVSINSVNEGNHYVSSNLPNSSFFKTYSEAYEFFSEKPLSFTHIVTSCTPLRGLARFDVINDNDVSDYLHKNHESELTWLAQYQHSFAHINRFKKLNNNLKFIIYSGAGYSTKPIDTIFGMCLNKFAGNYEYVPKTEKHSEDASKIIAFLKKINFIITAELNENGIILDRFIQQGIISPENEIERHVEQFIRNVDISTKNILQHFKDLIDNDCSEIELEMLMRKYPELLGENGYSNNLIIQPFLEDSIYKNKRPDLILRPLLETMPAKIIEYKLVNAKIVKNQKNNTSFSSKIKDAIEQIRRYQAYFENSGNSEKFNLKYGTKVFMPVAKLIIGKNYGNATNDEILFNKDQYLKQKIEIVTFTEVLELSKINRNFYNK